MEVDLVNSLEKAAETFTEELEKTLINVEFDEPIRHWLRCAFKVGAKWQKEQISAIVRQYSNTGEKNYKESNVYDDECSTNTCYWDGYRDCANGIKREMED